MERGGGVCLIGGRRADAAFPCFILPGKERVSADQKCFGLVVVWCVRLNDTASSLEIGLQIKFPDERKAFTALFPVLRGA